MSIETLAMVLHHSQASCTAKVVLLGIANHDGDYGAFPTVETLMKYTRTSRRSVQVALSALEDAGELRVHVNQGGTIGWRGDKRPNRYEILVSCPAECDRTTAHKVPSDGVQNSSPGKTDGVQDTTGRGAESCADGVTNSAPKPYIEPSKEPSLFVVADDGSQKSASKRARKLPEDWIPNDQHLAFVRTNGLVGAVELAQFRDHHAARGTTMKDWDAAFRTWLRNAVKYAGRTPVLSSTVEALPAPTSSWMERRPVR